MPRSRDHNSHKAETENRGKDIKVCDLDPLHVLVVEDLVHSVLLGAQRGKDDCDAEALEVDGKHAHQCAAGGRELEEDANRGQDSTARHREAEHCVRGR